MRILIVEDDERIGKNIQKMLEKERFIGDLVKNAEDALYKAEIEEYDVIILDRMLPDKEGIEVCRTLRKNRNKSAILMLTAKVQVEDKVEGLNEGADDYLTKPFDMKELISRVKALVRRKSGISQTPVISIYDLSINTNTCEVIRGDRNISLSPKEYSLLEYLARNSDRVVDRLELMSHVWGEELDEFSNTVDVHVRYLRRKIDEPFKKKLIKTVKNRGYMLCTT